MTGYSEDVNAYIEDAPEAHRWMMLKLRELVHQVVPEIEEEIAYRMPVFRRGETQLMAMASRSRYLAMYFDPEAVDRYRDELGRLDLGKGCVRVKRAEQLPVEAIEGILKTAKAGLCGR